MDRWMGKVAVVTGASSGIGLATAKLLVCKGMIVAGLARRKAVMEESMKDICGPGKFYAIECDLRIEENVIRSLKYVKEKCGTINVLVNNAGLVKHSRLEETSTKDLEDIIKVNLLGVVLCCKEVVKIMKENNCEAHILNVNSVLGHKVPSPRSVPFNVYPSTKFAVTALSETLRNELMDTKIRVTNLSPGLVKTDLMDTVVAKFPDFNPGAALEPTDVANSILYALGSPSTVEINEITLEAKIMT